MNRTKNLEDRLKLIKKHILPNIYDTMSIDTQPNPDCETCFGEGTYIESLISGHNGDECTSTEQCKCSREYVRVADVLQYILDGRHKLNDFKLEDFVDKAARIFDED